jgi:hypothetical protein
LMATPRQVKGVLVPRPDFSVDVDTLSV